MIRCGHFVVVALCCVSIPLSLRGADEKTPQGQWLAGVSDLTTNKSSTVWLVVQPMASAQSVTVSAGTPHDTAISISRSGGATCSSTPDDRISCIAPATDPLILEYKVTAHSPGTMRMLALIEYTSKDGVRSSYAVLSDPIIVRSAWEIGPTAIAVVSAVFGLIAGMLTQLFASWWQGKQDDRKVQRDVERALLTGLSVELVKNQTLLREYVDHAGTAPYLSVESYNALTNNPPVFGYLSKSSYLAKIDALYASIQKYHSKLILGEPTAAIHDAAAALLDIIAKGLQEAT